MKSGEAVTSEASESERAQEARLEVEAFVKALNSYPEKFADDPGVSFEQHFVAVAAGR